MLPRHKHQFHKNLCDIMRAAFKKAALKNRRSMIPQITTAIPISNNSKHGVREVLTLDISTENVMSQKKKTLLPNNEKLCEGMKI